ncbi:gliding motility-associated lipoprotein GldD [Parabacteroides sp. PF5-5]|uniref:gliding motility lipoprotein GldD n=1 Tax=unclassified Parabacteroides TaxID=2649774 RepID=UPI0024734D20|nr:MULTISPECIES: gliding motility protein GldD [unclassified Parabacteroides]MDH6306667.1 gliding motility-associated lipoprotein GldD [Parabacteroides sp. PH5-39]MDH6317634.1 gliding motility-associated lipoprotein GldD [Parabacteroides sp. PF5-13]MDH6321378.1 gliding motility-associated lipoprotein GldD [Parabacteroides sp. PH5-13]MDH6325057.1 gliding motility-associated lipoprotein GldD [Parabacteroides sp. PH5-8]MDH6328766.1 gliding motility-associated lipoprotein GldD [Parabacteroides sp.
MNKKLFLTLWILLLLLIVSACSEYAPKPRGYFRIEPPQAVYVQLPLEDLPYSFHVSSLAEIELPPVDDTAGWINVSYPALGAKIYCTYLSITPAGLGKVIEESRLLVSRQSKDAMSIIEQAYEDLDKQVYACLYQLDGASVSPIQFTLTDSTKNFFRGSLLFNSVTNADSIAPAVQYLKEDIAVLIQSFSWKK